MRADKQAIAPYPALPLNPPLQHLHLPPRNTTPNAAATSKFDRLNTNTKIIIASRANEVKRKGSLR